jgi:hypothetical protein
MSTRNPTPPSAALSKEPPNAASPTVQALQAEETGVARSGKAARKPRVEAQMRRRAEELRALLRDLD